MDLGLKGKRAFISGSTAGIGFGIARLLLQEGATVIINGRTQESVDSKVTQLIEEFPNGDVSGIAADFSHKQEVEKLIDHLHDIDILINNVGIYYSKNFEDTTDDEWYHQFEVNVMSGIRLSRALLPKMLKSGWGRIIFISSECSNLVPEDLISYSTTKAALLAISRGLAQLTKGSEVTVNTIAPGSTLTEGAELFLENLAKEQGVEKAKAEADFFKNIRTSSLLQRFAQVDEVAQTVVYYSSPLSSATNGSLIKIDGGSMGGIY